MKIEQPDMITLQVPFGQIRCHADTVLRVTDWARWAQPRLGLDAHGRCASAEGRHESEYPDAKRNMKIEVNLNAVMQVERIVITRLPKLHKGIIIRHFIKKNTPAEIAVSMAIPKAHYGEELKRSLLMIKNNLTRK